MRQRDQISSQFAKQLWSVEVSRFFWFASWWPSTYTFEVWTTHKQY